MVSVVHDLIEIVIISVLVNSKKSDFQVWKNSSQLLKWSIIKTLGGTPLNGQSDESFQN